MTERLKPKTAFAGRGRLRLSFLLVVYALSSLLFAMGVFAGGSALGRYIIDDKLYTKQRIYAREKEIYDEFSDYIKSEGISRLGDERLQKWFIGRDHLIIYIYDYNKQSQYLSSSISALPGGDSDTVMLTSISDAASSYALLQSEYDSDYWYHGPVEMKGAGEFPKVMRVMYFPMYTALSYVRIISAALSFIAFALCLTLLVRRKTGYISLLSNRLSVMAAGELNAPMPIKGRDELTTLAENMEGMRISFIERLKREEDMNKNASALLTDMSHDLRTPLTALIGYLDILDGGKAQSEEQKQRFISSAKKRAYQIKEMTDELFEYFLVYSYGDEKLLKESCDAAALLTQLWDECAFALESAGMEVISSISDKSAQAEADVGLMRRVFDNICSNIIKYADKSRPVSADFELMGDKYVVTVSNAVSERPETAESSGIGLNSCKKILKLHGGEFECESAPSSFVCRLKLPVLTRK